MGWEWGMELFSEVSKRLFFFYWFSGLILRSRAVQRLPERQACRPDPRSYLKAPQL